MIQSHAAAVLAALREDPVLRVHDGAVPNLPQIPYVVLWTAAPVRSSDRLSGLATNADAHFQTSAVGLSAEQVRLVQDHVHAQLLSVRLVVAGRSMALVRHLAAPMILRDDSVDPPLFLGADQWGVFSAPAAS
jgi:hypothetical protein